MKRGTGVYIADILEAMERVEGFVEGMEPQTLRTDYRTAYAVVKAFEIMGEAAKHVPDQTRARCPEVMWREMAGMRDRLSHMYWDIDLAFALEAIRERFPIERPALERLLAELDAEADDGS